MFKAGVPKLSSYLSIQTVQSCNRLIPARTLATMRPFARQSTFLLSQHQVRKAGLTTSAILQSAKTFIEPTDTQMDKNGIESRDLIKQRKQRPLSPHLTIYQPQLTWYMSSFHRLSLIFLGLAFYAVTMLFGVANLVSSNGLTTDKLVSWYHDKVSRMSSWVKWSIKGTFGYLFALQYGGAIRHLIWDTAKELSLKGVYRTGYALIGFTAIAGSYLLTL